MVIFFSGEPSQIAQNKFFNKLKFIAVVFYYYAIMILTLKRFSGRFEDVCKGPDAG